MTSMSVKLTKENLEQIALYIAEKYPVLKNRPKQKHSAREIEIDIRERIVRVEEELKNQREQIKQLLINMDKRFEQMDKRFEQVDRRFEQIDRRFEDVDKRFTMMMWFTGIGFTLSTTFITGILIFIK